jgi:hypothetical protein
MSKVLLRDRMRRRRGELSGMISLSVKWENVCKVRIYLYISLSDIYRKKKKR